VGGSPRASRTPSSAERDGARTPRVSTDEPDTRDARACKVGPDRRAGRRGVRRPVLTFGWRNRNTPHSNCPAAQDASRHPFSQSFDRGISREEALSKGPWAWWPLAHDSADAHDYFAVRRQHWEERAEQPLCGPSDALSSESCSWRCPYRLFHDAAQAMVAYLRTLPGPWKTHVQVH